MTKEQDEKHLQKLRLSNDIGLAVLRLVSVAKLVRYDLEDRAAGLTWTALEGNGIPYEDLENASKVVANCSKQLYELDIAFNLLRERMRSL